MKNILLIITLLISWNAIAKEKVWYCSTEERGGLRYDGNSWQVISFKPGRMTVRQKGNILSFSDAMLDGFIDKCDLVGTNTIQCTGLAHMFMLNVQNGLATSSVIYGWLSGEDGDYDTLSTSLWRCESF